MENILTEKGFLIVAYLIMPVMIILNLQRKDYNDQFLSKNDSQVLKGVSAVLIVLHHLSQRIGINLITIPFIEIGKYSVSLFLFLSGYGVMSSYKNNENYMQNFLKKRILSIYIPFIISNIIFIIIYKSRGRIFNWIDIIKYILGIKIIDGIMWFIFAIVVFYLIFYISFKYRNIQQGIIIFSLGTMVYLILGIILNLGTTITNISFAFLGGIIVSIYKEKFIKFLDEKYLIKVISIIGLLGVTRIISIIVNNILFREVILNISTLAYALLIVMLSKKFKLNGKIVSVLGTISFEIYLLHNKIIAVIPNINESIINISIYFTILILLSYIFNNMNKRINKTLINFNINRKEKELWN